MGSISVAIGPNGFGKTTYLENERKKAEAAHKSTLFLPSEIKLLDEVRDSVDYSQTMEFLLSEIIETPEYVAKREELYNEADKLIADNLPAMNEFLDYILAKNGSTRSVDFIAPNPKRTIKNLVSIGQRDIKDKMGSGQRMQLLLGLVSRSTKECIFLDEPEKYAHPSLLNETAQAINRLVVKGKSVCVATHSPKLVSMLKLNLTDIVVINDATHSPKAIPFDEAVKEASALLPVGSMADKFKPYYASGNSLMECIQKRHNRPFIEALFAKKVYLCEGANDELFVNASLERNGGYYDDYSVFKVWGKTNLVVFAKVFTKLGIPITILFDRDDESLQKHKKTNDAIRSLSGGSCRLIEFNPNVEEANDWPQKKKDDALGFIAQLEHLPALQSV